MFGSQVYKLNIYNQLENAQSSVYGKPIWQKEGNQGDRWLFGHIYVENPSYYYKMKFMIEAIVIIHLNLF